MFSGPVKVVYSGEETSRKDGLAALKDSVNTESAVGNAEIKHFAYRQGLPLGWTICFV